MRPDLTPEGHEFLFSIADKAGDGSIDAVDWLNVGSVIKTKLTKPPEEEEEIIIDHTTPISLRIKAYIK